MPPPSASPGIQKLLDHFNRRDEDLHRTFCEFLEADETEKVQILMDRFYEDLQDEVTMLLCNYHKAVDGRNKRHDMAKVSGEIAAHMGAIYAKYLGRPYQCRLIRMMNQRKEAT